jgi:hypothetical protein
MKTNVMCCFFPDLQNDHVDFFLLELFTQILNEFHNRIKDKSNSLVLNQILNALSAKK